MEDIFFGVAQAYLQDKIYFQLKRFAYSNGLKITKQDFAVAENYVEQTYLNLAVRTPETLKELWNWWSDQVILLQNTLLEALDAFLAAWQEKYGENARLSAFVEELKQEILEDVDSALTY